MAPKPNNAIGYLVVSEEMKERNGGKKNTLFQSNNRYGLFGKHVFFCDAGRHLDLIERKKQGTYYSGEGVCVLLLFFEGVGGQLSGILSGVMMSNKKRSV